MKRILLILLLLFTFSCKSSKRTKKTTKPKTTVNVKKDISPKNSNYKIVESIISKAKTYEGVRYKYGGTDKRGMDCSGLIVTSFKSQNIILPRTTGELSKYGDWIDIKEVQEGDLLFFATRKNSRVVNHVGIVTTANTGYVEFIHSTTSAGVITSKLSDRYWYFAFVQARRVI